MNLPYSDKLNIAALSRLFDNKAECYKLFWFQAVLEKVCAGAAARQKYPVRRIFCMRI